MLNRAHIQAVCADRIYIDYFNELESKVLKSSEGLVKEFVMVTDIICFVNHKNIMALVWFYIR
jgi:hypothetical protein